jgi:hypothetical protein
VLAWYRASRRGAFAAVGWAFAILAVVFTLTLGLSWVSTWVMWPIIALCLIGVYASTRVSQCRVGADWVANRKTWVRIYELVKVTCHGGVGDPELRLVDSDGRRTTLGILTMQNDRDIWDLTYNGILHSVIAGGAQTNGELHLMLHLPYPATDSRNQAQPNVNDSNDERNADS